MGEKADLKALEAQLAAVREARSEAEEERTEARRAEAIRRQIALEQKAIEEAPLIAKAEADHGAIGVGIAVIETDEGCVILRRPERVAFQRFERKGWKGKDIEFIPEEAENFVKSCLLYPDKSRFNSILQASPGVLMECANEAYKLGQGKRQEVLGK